MKQECYGCPHLVTAREDGAIYRECSFGAGIKAGSADCKQEQPECGSSEKPNNHIQSEKSRQWKPSKEQLNKLNQVIIIDSELWGEETREIMKSLYNDLKKL